MRRIWLIAAVLLCAVGAAVVFAQDPFTGMMEEPPAAQAVDDGGSTADNAAAQGTVYQVSNKNAPAKPSGADWGEVEFFGESDWTFVAKIAVRFFLNVLFAYILICHIFAKEHRIKEYSFCFFISNILIFMVTSLLASVKVKTGFAFGLFAILSILRYRTEQIQIREMTFLFASIIMGVINSLATDGLTIFAVLLADLLLCVSMAICDTAFMGVTDQLLLVYDNTALLAKEKKNELHEDIKKRFGYDVIKVVVTKMNYLTDSAEVKLVYKRS